MELDKFIADALTQILKGIRVANDEITGGKPIDEAPKPFLLEHGGNRGSGAGIEFDLAVTTKSEKKGKGSGKAKLLSVIEVEAGGGSSVAKEQVSRIKFTVFVNQWRG